MVFENVTAPSLRTAAGSRTKTLKKLNKIFVFQLTKESEQRVSKARQMVDDIVKENRVVYGITTGFGKFARTVIEKDKLK